MWSLLRITLVLSLAIFHSGLVSGQPGSEWSESEILIIKEKILYVIQNSGRAANEYKKRYPDRSYISQTIPNAAKMLRLGFHDCVRYQDANGKIVNGCDGCLSNKGMIKESMLDFHNTDKKTFKGPD